MCRIPWRSGWPEFAIQANARRARTNEQLSAGWQHRAMDDIRVGGAVRAVRIRRRWRQEDLATAAGVSRATISRLERGHLRSLSVGLIRTVAAALDVRIDLVARWRGGDLDRLVNARHSALHELVARYFRRLPAWVADPEVSFSIYGERGVIDILAWHPGRRALLVIELKTEIVDVNDLIGGVDRKRRLARRIANERGWQPLEIGCLVVVAASRTNRRRVEAHAAVLRSAFPDDGRRTRSWLRDPVGPFAGLAYWGRESRSRSDAQPGNARTPIATVTRVRRPAV
jgi:transcriptional regulator with XRE-family HTH domain